jgi:hypothetical protein
MSQIWRRLLVSTKQQINPTLDVDAYIKDKNGFDKNEIYDMSIYDKNKIPFLPLTTKKSTL